MYLSTKEIPESTTIFSIEAAGQTYNHNDADLSIEVNPRIRNAWCSFRMYTLKLDDRSSAPLKLKMRMLKSRRTRANAVRLSHVEPARVPLQHAAPSPLQLPESLHRLTKEQSH